MFYCLQILKKGRTCFINLLYVFACNVKSSISASIDFLALRRRRDDWLTILKKHFSHHETLSFIQMFFAIKHFHTHCMVWDLEDTASILLLRPSKKSVCYLSGPTVQSLPWPQTDALLSWQSLRVLGQLLFGIPTLSPLVLNVAPHTTKIEYKGL